MGISGSALQYGEGATVPVEVTRTKKAAPKGGLHSLVRFDYIVHAMRAGWYSKPMW